MLNDHQIKNLEILLEKIALIDQKHALANKQSSFNLFDILSKCSDEVNLHSRFIFELLNPCGTHQSGELFLRLFLATLQLEHFFSNPVKVQKEYKGIDILLHTHKEAIIIENKIFAGDQPLQLERYYKLMEAEGKTKILILYLTLDGKDATEESLGILASQTVVTNISYRFEILKWLEECLKASYNTPVIRENLTQYKLIVKKLTGTTMNNAEREDILNLLAKNDNVLKAQKIAENWIHVKWNTEWYFWRDLEAVINREYPILNYMKYSSEKLNNAIHSKRNRSPWYGLMFEIGKFQNDTACLLIERSDGSLYYGITMLREGERSINNEKKFDSLAARIHEISSENRSSYWLGRKYPSLEINFNAFYNDQTIMLLNDEFRKNAIDRLWIEITEYINVSKRIVKDLTPGGVLDDSESM